MFNAVLREIKSYLYMSYIIKSWESWVSESFDFGEQIKAFVSLFTAGMVHFSGHLFLTHLFYLVSLSVCSTVCVE